jgi:hypothetical protein
LATALRLIKPARTQKIRGIAQWLEKLAMPANKREKVNGKMLPANSCHGGYLNCNYSFNR